MALQWTLVGVYRRLEVAAALLIFVDFGSSPSVGQFGLLTALLLKVQTLWAVVVVVSGYWMVTDVSNEHIALKFMCNQSILRNVRSPQRHIPKLGSTEFHVLPLSEPVRLVAL